MGRVDRSTGKGSRISTSCCLLSLCSWSGWKKNVRIRAQLCGAGARYMQYFEAPRLYSCPKEFLFYELARSFFVDHDYCEHI